MNLKKTIEEAWENRDLLKNKDVQETIFEVVDQLDRGVVRVAEKMTGSKQRSSSISPSDRWKPSRSRLSNFMTRSL
jgi:hypothetical protein